MRRRRDSIYRYITTLVGGLWRMAADEIAALTRALERYQQDGDDDCAEAKLAIALTRVVEKRIRPPLEKRLRPQDVDDVCSEVILGFWKFRHSVRPGEVEKLINTLVKRKQADQLRGYYKDAEHVVREKSEEEQALLELLPAKQGDPSTEAAEDTWEQLSSLNLKSKDHLVAYLVCEGVEKQVIAEILRINATTIARSIKRCREALAKRSQGGGEKKADA